MQVVTNKQLLEVIVENQKKDALNQLEFATKVSNFINKQTLINEEQVKLNGKFANYLENDNTTNQIGIVQRSMDNSTRIEKLEGYNKVTAGKITVAGLILTTIGGLVLKLLGIIKFTI